MFFKIPSSIYLGYSGHAYALVIHVWVFSNPVKIQDYSGFDSGTNMLKLFSVMRYFSLSILIILIHSSFFFYYYYSCPLSSNAIFFLNSK